MAFVLVPSLAMAEDDSAIQVEPGDVLSISVVEASSLDREAKVDAQGRIMLPQLGSVAVAGLGLDEVGQGIKDRLAAQSIVQSANVIVEMAKYRPFYIGGAVERPGAITYDVGLTVRHALVLAGGLKLADDNDKLSVTDVLALHSKWRATAFSLLEVESRIARLEAELDYRATPDFSGLDTKSVDDTDAQSIQSLDRALLQDRLDVRRDDLAHKHDLIGLVDFELDVLEKQAAEQKKETALQQSELESVGSLQEQGLTSMTRLRDLEREQSRLSREFLEVQAYTARARQSKETFAYEIGSSDLKWRAETHQKLREAMLERTRIKADIDLQTSSLLSAGLSLTGDAKLAPPVPDVSIHRTHAGQETTLRASMSTEIRPGDVIEVSIAEAPQG